MPPLLLWLLDSLAVATRKTASGSACELLQKGDGLFPLVGVMPGLRAHA
jgi:hypothetical protein